MLIKANRGAHIIVRVELDDGTIHFLKLNQKTANKMLADTPSRLKQYVITSVNPEATTHVISDNPERAMRIAANFVKGNVISFTHYEGENGTND